MKKVNTKVESDFFAAIRNGKQEQVRFLVAQNPDLLSSFDYDNFGATPLTSCTFRDDREMIATLLEVGANPNRKSDWEMGPWSPLHSAIQAGNHDLARFLLNHGAMIDIHTAAGLGDTETLNVMLSENPLLVSDRGGDGCQPLHFAGSIAATQLLVDFGADLEARCVDHFSTPVQYIAHRNPEVARFLFSIGANPDIFSAVLAGDGHVVKKLLEKNPDCLIQKINQQTYPPGPQHDVHNIMTFSVGHNATPLHAAAKTDQSEMIRLLVEAGIGINIRGGYDDATALHIAAWENHVKAAQTLIDLGANVNALSGDIHNNSPAGWAIVAGSADVFCMLLDCGAEKLNFFENDAQAAVDGAFRQFKVVPQENYDCILNRTLEKPNTEPS